MAIYVRNKEGDLTPLNIPTIKGKDGINGVDGVTPNIEVGEITTIETGQEVTATIEGSKENPIIKFSIPKGIDGENGEEGNITIDDNNISEESVWSPEKITGEVKKSNDKLKEIKSKNEDQDNKLKEVERKNELQDFYINGLFNENSHNRMVIEEEGNEIKLEGSKKGFVELDKIVGNTLVNRVNEPMKELTLNGDIDEKGFSITTNESVENGLVDVVCEGNTLVNLLRDEDYTNGCIPTSDGFYKATADGTHKTFCCPRKVNLIKPNTEYTFVIFIRNHDSVSFFELNSGFLNNQCFSYSSCVNLSNGVRLVKLTSLKDLSKAEKIIDARFTPECKNGSFEIKMMLIEGDLTTNPPTEYFEGMKSVGEQADGNHKIEILSNNKNLIHKENIKRISYGYGNDFKYNVFDQAPIHDDICIGIYPPAKIEPNTSYYFDFDSSYELGYTHIFFYDKNGNYLNIINHTNWSRGEIITTPQNAYYFTIFPVGGAISDKDFETVKNTISLTKSSTAVSYVEGKSNKKEISLKEPLRGLPNKVKDRIIKIDGKWFVERNILTTIIGADEKWNNELVWNNSESKKYMTFTINRSNFREKFNREIINSNSSYSAVSNNIPCNGGSVYKHDKLIFAINGHVNLDFQVSIPKSDLKSLDIDGVNKYFTDNPLTLLVQTSQPIYEPLETAPELVCYDEVTHISNNSMIPCNMVVKNTGFSCMSLLKDSPYTAVHNGDKGVTAKVDIADNMVRLHGKGKTVSDVTVVDGNVSKLHYTFKGMKSSFEDKLVTQEMVDKGLEKAENLGKYKVNVKVTGKNLFDKSRLSTKNNVVYGGYLHTEKTELVMSLIDKDTSVDISGMYLGFSKSGHMDDVKWAVDNGMFDNKKTANNIYLDRRSCFISFYPKTQDTIDKLTSRFDIQIEKGINATQYEPYKEYSTSVYLNSPLLKGDEIVMKEDGIYHYHKMSKVVLDGNGNNFITYGGGTQTTHKVFRTVLDGYVGKHTDSLIPSDIMCDKYKLSCFNDIFNLSADIVGTRNTESYFYIKSINQTIDELNQQLQAHPITVIYELAEPYYEKISDTNILLDVPNNATLQLDSMLPCQNVKLNYTGKIPNLSLMKNNISIIEERNINTIANNFDMDFRLIELEQALKESKLNLTNTRKSNNISSNRFQQAKILILANRYNKEKMTYQLSKYLERGYLNQEEFDELINLMK